MRALLKICFLAIVSALGWWIGGRLSTDALALALGCLFGVMAGIPIALIALSQSKQARLDIYHHSTQETLPEPAQPHPVGTLALSVCPTRYVVVGEPVQQLQAAQHKQIEVQL